MNFVTQLIYFIILFVLSSQQVFADEIAVLSLGREASRIQTSSNGDKILEYTSIYRYDNLLDAIIGAEGTLAKHDIVNWSDMEGICKIPEKKEILKIEKKHNDLGISLLTIGGDYNFSILLLRGPWCHLQKNQKKEYLNDLENTNKTHSHKYRAR